MTPAAPPRAGIVVTGTEVLTGRVTDRNGPWLADRLFEVGVDLSHIDIVGDRPEDMLASLRFMADQGVSLIITSGGLGPTADDLTAEIVGRFQEREMVLDEPLMGRIADILRPLARRWPHLDMDAVLEANRKQAVIPAGATILEPVGTAPGLVVPPPEGRDGPYVLVLPGPPRELQPMWRTAVQTEAFKRAIAGAIEYRQEMLRLFGIPESEIAETLRAAEREGVEMDRLEITTCLRRGEVEVVTRFAPDALPAYEAFAAVVAARHADTLFSTDGRSVDEQVADLLLERGWTIGTAESCTGGLLAGRLTERPGSSAYVRGGVVAYSNDVKIDVVGVPAALIEEHGAVSGEVAVALADGAVARLGVDVGVGITGVAGPDGGSDEKPVGLVWLSVCGPEGAHLTRSVNLPGGRFDVRDRSTTVAMHLVRRLLLGEVDEAPLMPAPEGGLRLRS
jgi:nicotinamide-nucleotide amidase